MSYSNYQSRKIITGSGGQWTGSYCNTVNPCFASSASNDFHLTSKAGRWNGSSWVTTDTVSSPCIDKGDPTDNYSIEPSPNGGNINMGFYGNTDEASKAQYGTIQILGVYDDECDSGSGEWLVKYTYGGVEYAADGIWHNEGDDPVSFLTGNYKITYNGPTDFSDPSANNITLTNGYNYQNTVNFHRINWWVSTTGNDTTGIGSNGYPFATINKGISEAATGEKVTVKSGTYNQNVDFDGKAITVQGQSNAVINYNTIVFDSGETRNSVLDNFIIQYGLGSQSGSTRFGGGIALLNSSPTIKNCDIKFNTAEAYTTYLALGGGIYIGGGSPKIEDCKFRYNIADGNATHNGYGGAIFTYNTTAEFDGCEIGNPYNTAYNNSASDEIYTDGSTVPTYSNCAIRDGLNGIYCNFSTTPPVDGGGNTEF